MTDPWEALYTLWANDSTLKTLLVTKESGKAGFFPAWPDETLTETSYPRVTTPGRASQDMLSATTGDFEFSTFIHVPTSLADPDAKVKAIEERMLALAHLKTWTHSSVRVSARLIGGRDTNVPGMLRRRLIWAVGVN